MAICDVRTIYILFIRRQKGVKVLLTVKVLAYYLGDKNRFDVSSKGPSSGISRKSSKITLIPDEGPLLETSNLFLSPR